MKYYIAADGGGTKLNAVLYDENFCLLRAAKTGGINTVSRDENLIRAGTERAAADLLCDSGIKEIEELSVSLANRNSFFYDAVCKFAAVKRYVYYNEGKAVLASAGLKYGLVAQAGTGSDIFVEQQGFSEIFGGLGSIFGDEGGGFDIGVKTIKSAIAAYEGRGAKTLLQPMVFQYFGIEKPRDLLRFVQREDFREKIAKATYLTEEAAKQGDKIARKIYRAAGREMAEQTLSALRTLRGKEIQGKIIVSGGAWKGCAEMFSAFKNKIGKHCALPAEFPVFEPVVGCAIARYFAAGADYKDIEKNVRKNFSDYLFRRKT